MQIFKVFTFGGYLSETCALTSRANVAEKGMITLVALLRFCLREKALKMLKFDGFLSLKSPLLATFILTFSKIFERNCLERTKFLNVSIF